MKKIQHGRAAGVGVLGVAGVIGGSLVLSQTAFAAGSTITSISNAKPPLCEDGKETTGNGTPGSKANPLQDEVTICGTTLSKMDTLYGDQPVTVTVTFWQTYEGSTKSTQKTQLSGDVVLDVATVVNGNKKTTELYVPLETVTGKAAKDRTTVTLNIPTNASYSAVTGGYFRGFVESNTKPIELHYDVEGVEGASGTDRGQFSLKGNAWIDPGHLGTPIAPLFGNDGMKVVGLLGVASAGLAAAVIRRRQISAVKVERQ